MAVYDFSSLGGGMAPSEPSAPEHPALPMPPINMPGQFGNFLGSLGSLGSQALFNRNPQQVGQEFSDFGSGVNSAFSSVGNAMSPIAQDRNPMRPLEAGLPPLEMLDPNSPLFTGAKLGGSLLNQGLRGIEQATAPGTAFNVKADNPVTTAANIAQDITDPLAGVHSAAILGQGVGNLLQDAPQIDKMVLDSFRQGASTTFSNSPDAEKKNREAIDTLMSGVGRVTSDLFDPSLMNRSIYDGFISNGADTKTAKSAADMLAGPISTISSYLTPNGLARLMLVEFVGNLINHPSEAIDSVKQSGGDFFNLLGTTASWMSRGGRAPSPEEVSKGLTGLANSLGTLALVHGIGSEGLGKAGDISTYASQKLAARNIDRMQKQAIGQSPTGAIEMADKVGEAALVHANEEVPEDTNAQKYGDILGQPEFAGLRNSLVLSASPSDAEFASHAEDLGAKVNPPGTISTSRSGSGFMLEDGSFVELPRHLAGYDHADLLEDMGIAYHGNTGSTAIGRFVRDSGAIAVHGRTDFTLYGLTPDHMSKVADGLRDMEDYPHAHVTVEDVQDGRGYSFPIDELRRNNWDVKSTIGGAASYEIPKVDEYGAENIQQTTQAVKAGTTSQVSPISQASESGTSQASGGSDQGSATEGSALASTQQTDQGIQGENLPASNAKSVSSPLEFVGGHAEGIPGEIRSSVQDLLAQSGINADGFVKSVLVDHNPGISVYGSWSPFVDPRTIHIDLPNMGSMAALEAVHNLRTELNSKRSLTDAQLKGQGLEALRREGLTPETLKSAFDEAERVIKEASTNLRPDTMIQWIAAHEALHATLGKIYGYPPDGLPDTNPGSNGHLGRIVEGVHMISHMDSTPEGKAWLDHTATQMGLKGEVGQLRMLARQAGNIRGKDLYDSLGSALTGVQRAKISTAEEAVNEALVHSVLNGKDLSPYPYWHQSGDKAHAISFYKPETTKENARLAAAYYDRYRSEAVPEQSTTAPGASAAGLPTDQYSAARFAKRDAPDQARIEADRRANEDDWKSSLHNVEKDISNLLRPSGSPLDNTALDRLKLSQELLSDRLRVMRENPGMSVSDVIKLSNARMKPGSPEVFEAPKPALGAPEPGKITQETAAAAVNKLNQERQDRGKVKAKTLAEINAISPAPNHYSDPRLTDADRDKLARTSIGQINRAQRALEAAETTGDQNKINAALVQKTAVAAFWKKFFEDKTPDTYKVEEKSAQPVDYATEAGKIASYSDTHDLAPLKDLANGVVDTDRQLAQAVDAGATPAEIAEIKGKAQFTMTKFRSAYDLYTSPVFKDKIDKQSYDWRQTRKIASRVAGIKASPNERAQIVARLIGEQVFKRGSDNPYTLADAGEDLRKTAMGISKAAKNWHPEVKKALAGELWNVARKGWEADPTIPLGVKNIPVHELLEEPDLAKLHESLTQEQAKFNDQIKQFNDQLKTAKILENTGKLAKGSVIALERSQKAKNLQFANERVRLQSLIDNHPQTAPTRAQNFMGLTRAEVDAMPLPSERAAQEAMGENPNANVPIEQLIADAEALNARIADPAPNPFSLESFLDEGSGLPGDESAGRSVGDGPNNGKPWFTPGWAKALTDLREMGGNHALLADLSQDLLMKMGEHLDPSRSMMHPMQWFKAHWESLAGIPYRVHQIDHVIQDIVHESRTPSFSKAIVKAIDSHDDASHLREIATLTPEQAKLARFFNEYWKTVSEQFKDPVLGETPLIRNFVDNYVPHIVLKDPEGNPLFDARKNMWSRNSGFAKERIQQSVTNEPVFKALQDLEDKGYTVEWNLNKIFSAHANSTFRMMKIREMFNTLRGSIYKSQDGSFNGFPIVKVDDLPALKRDAGTYRGLEILDTPEARVRFGPGDAMFQQYKVHPELARYIERLASARDLNTPGMGVARFLRSLGGLFKFIQFSINPRHAFNVFSNVANLHSPAGLLSPRIWTNIYGRANRAMMPVDRSTLYNATHRTDVARTKALLRQKALVERNMRDVFETMQREGFDPLDPIPTAMGAREADLRQRYSDAREDLVATHNEIDKQLAVRDRRLLANLMDKGLVPDKDIIEGADLNALSNYTEKIPGMAQFHKWMWRDVVWRGQVGTAMHLADQFTMKAAEKNGWKGKGNAAEAEKFVDPDMLDSIHREAVYYAKQGTALLNKLDMTSNWQVWGRATLLSAPWTLGQLQAARDSVGNNPFSRMLGRGDFTQVSDKQLESGFGQDKARFLDDMHTKLARRMVYSGTAKLLMTSMIMSTLGSYILTNNVNTPLQNFLRDPMHTFDVYSGKDPATHRDIWIDTPFFGFQHELINYVLAGVKAVMEGKGPLEIGVAPFARFSYKSNPMANLLIDLATGIEVSRYIAGIDPLMSNDEDLQNLHTAMDQLGVPDFGSLEDRLMYAVRVMMPSPGGFATTAIKRDPSGNPVLDEQGNEIPLTDPKSILSDFGIGGFINPAMDIVNALPIPNSPAKTASMISLPDNLAQELPKLGLFAAGATSSTSNPLYDADISRQGLSVQQDPNGYYAQAAKRSINQANHDDYIAHQTALVQIGKLAAQGTPEAYAKIQDIRDANGLTDSQVVNAMTYSQSVVNNKGNLLKSQGIVGKGQPASGIVSINGRDLDEKQSIDYNKSKNDRHLYVMMQLQNNSTFKSADSTTKLMMINQMNNLADKFTTAQAGQQYQGIGGQTLTDQNFKNIVSSSLTSRDDIKFIVQSTPEFQQASPNDKLRMLQSYNAMADTITWDKELGDLKSLNQDQMRSMVINSVQSEAQATSYLRQTPFYQSATPEQQMSMEREYGNLAKQMNVNIFNGKSNAMNPVEIPMYLKAVINTEETSKYLLHQSDFYQMSSLASQQSLDSKYANYSRSLALKDWQKGRPILNINDAGSSFSVGPEQLIVGHLMAEQGYNDLMNQYGGSSTITAYQQQLSEMKKQIKENIVATPTQLSRMQTILGKQFEAANPQYAAFLKARTAWERGTTVGRLYLALNADEQALAINDTSVIADTANINIGDTLDQAVDGSSLYASNANPASDLTPLGSTQSLFDTLPG